MRSAPVLLALVLIAAAATHALAAPARSLPVAEDPGAAITAPLPGPDPAEYWSRRGAPLPGSAVEVPLRTLFTQPVTSLMDPLPLGPVTGSFSPEPRTRFPFLDPATGSLGRGLLSTGPETSPGQAGCDAPIGTPDFYRVAGDGTLSVASPGFLANDIDLDGEVLTATAILDNVDHGSLSAFGNGSFTYTPDPGFTGTDVWAYRMRDASNNLSDSVTVTIEVLPPANRDPVGVDDRYAMPGEMTLSIAAPGFLANDVDLDGEALTATAILDNVDHGSLAAFGNGSFAYTPDPGFTGTDSFVYRMRDASDHFTDSVTVAIDVYPGNRAPQGTDDAYAAVIATPLSIPAPGFLQNDYDADGDALTATAILDNVDHGSLAAFGNGSFTYTPDPGFTGTDSFVYRMRDAADNFSDSVRVVLEVQGPGTLPVGTPDYYRVAGDDTLSMAAPGFLANDIDLDGEALTATAILDNVDHGSLAAFGNGSFTYTPDSGFTGIDSFAYRMRDASNNLSDSVTVTIEVLPPANRDPVGVDDRYAMPAGVTLSIAAPGFLANDVDLDGEALTAVSILDSVDHGSLAAFGNGSFTYTPDPGFTGTDVWVYRMRDASDHFTDSVTVAIDVYPGNRAPQGTDDAYAAVIATPLSIAAPGFLQNDYDADGDALTATAILDNVDHGSLTAFGDGSFTYTPDAGFSGTDTFVYRMRDAANNFSDSVRVAIRVISPEAPILADITGPVDPVLAGSAVHLAAGFASHASSSYTAVWNWGDGTTSPGTVTQADCAGTVTGDHAYLETGSYTVTLTVTSEHGFTGESVFEPLVVVGPGGGFVTAGGWIASPPGAYLPDPAAEGKANFSFNSRYARKDTIPRGNARFQLHAAGMTFTSSRFDWLIVDGKTATLRGTGTVNKTGNFGFRITAVDGDLAGDPDALRIRIWDQDAGNQLLYDNQPGDPEAAVSDAIEAGQIMVNNLNPGQGIAMADEAPPVRTALLPNAPNPFRAGTTIRFDLAPGQGGSAGGPDLRRERAPGHPPRGPGPPARTPCPDLVGRGRPGPPDADRGLLLPPDHPGPCGDEEDDQDPVSGGDVVGPGPRRSASKETPHPIIGWGVFTCAVWAPESARWFGGARRIRTAA